MTKRISMCSIVLLISVVIVLPCAFGGDIQNLDAMNYGREGNDNFVMLKNLEGEIRISSAKDRKTSRRINLLDLDTDSPQVIFEGNYGARMPFKKIYESSDYLVIQQQAWPSLDVITINKKNGVFVRMASGIAGGTYVIAEKGQLD